MPEDLLVREETKETDRPTVVSAVAAYQWVKAALLGLQFWILWSAPASTSSVRSTQAGTAHDPFLVALLVTAIFFVIQGFGLWTLQKWALYAILPIGFMCGTYAVGQVDSLNWIKEYIPRNMLIVALVIDVAAVIALARREVFKAFSAEDDDTQMLSM